MYKYYEAPKLTHCPTDKRFRKEATGGPGDGAYRTYSFIAQMNTRDGSGLVNNGWLVSENEICRKITDISNPGSKYMLIEENDNRGINMGSWVMDLRPGNLRFVDPFAVFHNMRSILGFADGHSEKIVWKDKRTEEFSKQMDEGGSFYSPVMNDNVDLIWLRNSYAKNQ